MNTILKNELFRRFISILFLILIWEIISRIIGDKIILPSPSNVLESIKYHASQDLFHHVYITLFRVFTAFFLAMIIGSAIGIVMGRKKKLDDYFDGWLILALNIPALVTIILCFIWFGLNEVAAILAVTINKIPTVTVILREGTKAIDEKLVDTLTLAKAKEILPQIGFGMEKKILAATEALEMGVTEAIIANGQRENPISSAIAHNHCTVIKNE